MADYLYQRDNLIGVFELKASMYSQLTTFNKSYQVCLFLYFIHAAIVAFSGVFD